MTRGTKEELKGGTAEENAKITRDILDGKITGTKRNAVILNAGASIYVAGKADTIAEGMKIAAEMIDSGKAKEVLENYIKESNI